MKIKTHTYKLFADQITPVNMYLNVRDKYAAAIMLESNEINRKNNARSIIAADVIANFHLKSDELIIKYHNVKKSIPVTPDFDVIQELNSFIESFEADEIHADEINGFFGFQSFEAVRFFETKKADLCANTEKDFPLIDYRLYRFIICINHFNNEITFIENITDNSDSLLDEFRRIVLSKKGHTYPFSMVSDEKPDMSDDEFIDIVQKAKHYCKQGDIFQVVLSRKFSRRYKGDDLNIYRALRHINPSPYMFYFDYGSFKIFGSSPEAQLRIENGKASISPIAGTYKKTGNVNDDEFLKEKLMKDEKELAEHVMLVDLARNDLNRNCTDVNVEEYKTIQEYSHVIHIASKVCGKLNDNDKYLSILADTFPAGTLSGAPKVKAIRILADLEKSPRGYYGGSIGYIDFNGNLNQAIIIRSFLAKKNEIYYRAGAGIVYKSTPESELHEIDNKLAALRKALSEAEKL